MSSFLKFIRFLEFLIFFGIAQFCFPQPLIASCRSIFDNSKTGFARSPSFLKEFSVYVIRSDHNQIDEIIKQVLSIQKSLLINKKPIHEITLADVDHGFLIGEMQAERLKESLVRQDELIVGVCRKNPDQSEDQLAGYAILGSIDYFENPHKDNSKGTLTLSISQEEWNHFISLPNIKYIKQIAVDPKLRRKGIGQLLVDTCKQSSPNGLLADVLYWPTPFVNQASYCLFLKNNFRNIGSLYINDFPTFMPCKTHVLIWNSY